MLGNSQNASTSSKKVSTNSREPKYQEGDNSYGFISHRDEKKNVQISINSALKSDSEKPSKLDAGRQAAAETKKSRGATGIEFIQSQINKKKAQNLVKMASRNKKSG